MTYVSSFRGSAGQCALAVSQHDSYNQLDLNYSMYGQRLTQNSRVGLRRNAFMKDIQNLSRENLKRRYRSQMIRFLDHQELGELIDKTEKKIQGEELDLLVQYANQQYPKAVGHLGNLIIEGVVAVARVQKYQLKPGYHPYWMWLIEVLVEQQYCTLGLLDHCIKAISPLRSEKTVKQALSVLFKITSSSMHSPLLFRDENTFVVILNACFRNDAAASMGYLLLWQLVKKDGGDMKARLGSGILRQKMVNALINGSMKVQRKIKTLTCKIMYELLLKDIFFEEMFESCIILIKQTVQLGIEELMLDFLGLLVEKATLEDLMHFVYLGLIVELGQWKKLFQASQDHESHDQLIIVSRNLLDKVSQTELTAKGVHRELLRFGLLNKDRRMQHL